ncbi:PepSY domain-containing protein [Brochothrix thermosphacta]|uniref:PepSY domain-containing protein n=1 Tax=Brochothrix thermosphacta TaxID=2756 RepID=UPI00271449E7|nr:PepSY domain-containing protein [Brochothrix thermosphacta]MDO7863885.1 PepSY domain-containing protein [Brochothrix thermosphacta]
MKRYILLLVLLTTVLLVACGNNATDKQTGTAKENDSENAVKNTNEEQINNRKFKVTLPKAVDQLKETYSSASLTGVELEKDWGNFVYEVSGVDDERSYKVEINAETGELMSKKAKKLDKEDRGGVEKQQDSFTLDDLMTMDEVMELTLKEAGKGYVTQLTLEKELDFRFYEITVMDGDKESTYKIDAKTGKVLEVEEN